MCATTSVQVSRFLTNCSDEVATYYPNCTKDSIVDVMKEYQYIFYEGFGVGVITDTFNATMLNGTNTTNATVGNASCVPHFAVNQIFYPPLPPPSPPPSPPPPKLPEDASCACPTASTPSLQVARLRSMLEEIGPIPVSE